MRYHISVFASVIVATSLGCQSSEPAASPPKQDASAFADVDTRAILRVTPDDLLSVVGTTPVMVEVSGAAEAPTLTALASAVSLRTYPELTPVAFKASIHPPDPLPGPGGAKDASVPSPDGRSFVAVVPSAPLDPARWYIVTVGSVPSGIVPAPVGVRVGGETLYGARFRVGSAPVIRRVEAMEKGDVYVSFSEGVNVDAKTLTGFLSVQNADKSACSYVPTGSQPVPPYQSGVHFKCAAKPSLASLTVVLNPGLESSSKLPLAWLDGSATTQTTLTKTSGTFSSLGGTEPCGVGCSAWRP